MKCYYEVLGVDRDADSAEIKTSYRKLALKWHPDKNLSKPTEAKEQFQAVQSAYEVLSDPQERAWYDSHREQLMRGAGTSFSDDSLDLIPYFTTSCYKGFGDEDKGFYAVYKEVFHKLAAEEVDYMDDPEDVSKIPMFGKSDSDYESVHEFYSHWMSFSTSKSYVWLDKYDIREADNRRVLKMIEKENNKIRQKARKERNDEIRNLVSFVRRRDKRVIAHAKLMQEKADEHKIKVEKMRKEKILQRHIELEEEKKKHSDNAMYAMNDFHQQLDEIEKHLAEEFGHSEEEMLTDDSEDENANQEDVSNADTKISDTSTRENTNISQGLYCTACSKLFKNVKSFQNHENSKKHKENVVNIKLETDIDFSDDEKSALASDGSDKEKAKADINGDADDAEILSEDDEYSSQNITQSKKKKKKNKKQAAFLNSHSDDLDESNLEDLSQDTRSRRARKAKTLQKVISQMKEEIVESPSEVIDSENLETEIKDELNGDLKSNSIDNVDETVNEDASEKVVESEALNITSKKSNKTVDNNTGNKGKEKKISSKQKAAIISELDVSNLDTSHFCVICKNEFPSKNKLFDHLKKTGHSVYLPTAQQPAVKVSKKKGKK